VGCSVEEEGPRTLTKQCGRGLANDGFEACADGGVVPLRVLVDPGDGAAGQDVVELLQEHQPPEPLQFGCGVRERAADGGRGAPEFSLTQEVLTAPVAALGLRLAGVRAAVEFKVHLPHPDGQGGVPLLCLGEEALGGTHPDLG
jgi:hypothetical protein